MAGSPTGNAITNEIAYIANMLGKGRMPYGGSAVGNYLQQLSNPWQRRPTPPRTAQETGMYGRYIPGGQQQSFGGSPDTTPGGTRPPVAAPPTKLSPEEQAYNAERSRIAQLTAQNPEFQNIGQLRNDLRDKGMEIWAQKYGKTLAPKVKPGQSGYDVIQRTLYPGGTPAPELSAESEAMLNAIAPANEFGVRPDVTPMPGQLPSFGSATEAMFNAITAGGTLVTPMPQKSIAATPQDQAQGLAETYKKALLSGLGNDPLGIAGIRQYGQ